MKPLPHHYVVHLSGGPVGYASLSTTGMPQLQMAPPVEYDGPGDAWSPEHLLLAAIQACFLFTLRVIAGASKLEFTRLEVDAAGTVARIESVTRFTEIVLRARVAVPPGTDHERALQILQKAEKKCLVSASLSTPVRLEAEIGE